MAKGRLKTQYNRINPIFVSNKVKSPNLKTVENNKNKGNKKFIVSMEKKIRDTINKIWSS